MLEELDRSQVEAGEGIQRLFSVSAAPDGSLCMQMTRVTFQRTLGRSFVTAAAFGAMCAVSFKNSVVWNSLHGLTVSNWPLSVVGVLFALVALLGAAGTIWKLLVSQEWWVAPDHFRWRCRFCGLSWQRELRRGRVQIAVHRSRRTVTYSLVCSKTERSAMSLFFTSDRAEVNELAGFLSARLEWPLDDCQER